MNFTYLRIEITTLFLKRENPAVVGVFESEHNLNRQCRDSEIQNDRDVDLEPSWCLS